MKKNTSNSLVIFEINITFAAVKEDWQSDRMRWTRNPVYPFSGIGGLNPSSSANSPIELFFLDYQ